nr:MAG TPA: hypothetical protein [Caudoviricetes sp.]
MSIPYYNQGDALFAYAVPFNDIANQLKSFSVILI